MDALLFDSSYSSLLHMFHISIVCKLRARRFDIFRGKSVNIRVPYAPRKYP